MADGLACGRPFPTHGRRRHGLEKTGRWPALQHRADAVCHQGSAEWRPLTPDGISRGVARARSRHHRVAAEHARCVAGCASRGVLRDAQGRAAAGKDRRRLRAEPASGDGDFVRPRLGLRHLSRRRIPADCVPRGTERVARDLRADVGVYGAVSSGIVARGIAALSSYNHDFGMKTRALLLLLQATPALAQSDGVRLMLTAFENALLSGRSDSFNSLVMPAILEAPASAARAASFADSEFRTGATRAVIQERDRQSLVGALAGNGFRLIVDAFVEYGDRARVATWQLDIRRVGEDDWKIADQE